MRFHACVAVPKMNGGTCTPLCKGTKAMNGLTNYIFRTLLVVAFAMIFITDGVAQSTTGTVSMSATVSKFVEINSGGAVTLSGNTSGGITTNGVLNSPLAVVINLGEVGPSNTNSFVTVNVPLKLRSNAPYVMTALATVVSSGATANRITAADVGFGLGAISRTGVGVNTSGADTNSTAGDPTLPANGAVNPLTGRFEFTAVRSNLGAFTASTTALNGAFIMNAVPRTNANGLTVPAIFAIKPQFFENGTTTATVTFTVTAP